MEFRIAFDLKHNLPAGDERISALSFDCEGESRISHRIKRFHRPFAVRYKIDGTISEPAHFEPTQVEVFSAEQKFKDSTLMILFSLRRLNSPLNNVTTVNGSNRSYRSHFFYLCYPSASISYFRPYLEIVGWPGQGKINWGETNFSSPD